MSDLNKCLSYYGMLSIDQFKKINTNRKLRYYKKYRMAANPYHKCCAFYKDSCFDELCKYVSDMKGILDKSKNIKQDTK